MVMHVSHGHAIRAVDGASGCEISIHASEAFNVHLRAMTTRENQIIYGSHEVNSFGDCLKGDRAMTFFETIDCGNNEGRHD